MAETALQRLLVLSSSLPSASLRKEQRDLVYQLAGDLHVPLDTLNEDHSTSDASSIETNKKSPRDVFEAPKKQPRSPREEIDVGSGPSSARAKFQKQEQQGSSASPVKSNARKSVIRSPPLQGGSSGNSDCDISSPDIKSAYEQVRDDSSSVNWISLGYGSSKKALELYASGEGGLEEFKASLKSDEVTYGYVRMIYGDSQRFKFVFIAYVPDGLSILTKARANTHKPAVTQYLKFLHTDIYATSLAELEEDIIQAKLKAAAGANYGTGGTAAAGSEDFGSMKDTAKNFFQQTEAKGARQSIVYHKGPLSDTTPVALQGRAGITEKYIKV